MAKNYLSATERKVAKYISQQCLVKPDAHYIVALSGGADSVALLSILSSLGISVSAAHCNFHLRSEESDRDEQFCVDLCQRWGIYLHRIHFDTLAYAEQHKVSIEMAARDLRYHYFAQLAMDIEAEGICVAHHKDDNAETLLLNLLRGSGIDGLAAIAPKNGNIIRPLLCLNRQEILAYLKEKGQDYVTDSTNLEDDALRNKIRHHVIPLLQTLNPAASENIAQSAKYLRQAKMMLDGLVGAPSGEGNFIKIDRKRIETAACPEYMLHHELGRFGFHGDVIDQMLLAMSQGVGKTWQSNDYIVAIDREQLLVTPIQAMESLLSEKAFRIPEEGNYSLASDKNHLLSSGESKLRLHTYPRPADFTPSKDSHHITLDADKVSFPLTYRLTEEGDRFHPFGMRGTKLVSDYLTDRKRDYLQKKSQHVLTDKEGNIIWLVGERTSERCKIDETTQRILEISLEDRKNN